MTPHEARAAALIENRARAFAERLARDYGASSALLRAQLMGSSYAYKKHKPRWLMRAIEILEKETKP